MKTIDEFKRELKNELAYCNHENDGTLAAQVNENIQWAWDNWSIDFAPYYEGTEKPERYTKEFMEDWINNEPFDTELESINANE
jgi:hypothetical protein